MKSHHVWSVALCFVFLNLPASAAVLYVNMNSTSPTVPFANWTTAATTIQDAIDAANPGDQILVTNGVYQTGGYAVNGFALANRVAVTKAVVVQSVNGPAVTVIQGYQVPGPNYGDGDSAVRCAYLTNNAVLTGFTLTNGATRTAGDFNHEQFGAGVWCESSSAVVSNCVLANNSAWNFGGGAYQGTLNNCTLVGNLAYGGGAAISATLNNCLVVSNWAERLGGGVRGCTLSSCTLTGNYGWNGGGGWESTFYNCILSGNSAGTGGGGDGCTFNNCTLTGNSASNSGGGALSSTLNNSIVYYNGAGGNYDSSCTFNFSCTTPDPGGTGNTTAEPLFVNLAGGDLHLQSNSPCINTGNNTYVVTTNDFDGNPRVVDGVVDMGAYEFQTVVPFVVSIQANGTNAVAGYSLNFAGSFLGGLATALIWDFGDGTTVSNQISVSHSWSSVGIYTVVLKAFNGSNPAGVSAAVTVRVVPQVIRYVSLNSLNPTPPYTNWATAAVTIQDAIDAASSGDLLLVSNGIYRTGGRLGSGSTTTNRAAVIKALTVQSVNGPATTFIDGAGVTRCVYLADGASLTGFSLTNGFTSDNGGGVWCNSISNLVTNCVFIGNNASSGGAAYQGTLNNCFLANNVASFGGGGYSSTLNNCTLTNNSTGAATFSILNNCILVNNDGGNLAVVYYCTLTNCILSGNLGYEPCSFSGTLINCLLTGNDGYAVSGGDTLVNCTLVGNTNGIVDSAADNCIIYGNDTQGGANYVSEGEIGTLVLENCCTTPDPAGVNGSVGNITNQPAFVDSASGDFHLQSESPCINSGNNTYIASATDLDGNPRIKGGTVDIGAYEFQTPSSVISYAWLQQYGLPTDGSADFLDTDGDGMNNWQEWRTGTSPIDPSSVLKMLTLVVTNNPLGVIVSWQSVSGINYFVQYSGDLSAHPAFSTIQNNIAGQAGTTSYLDTNAVGHAPFFYRVGVQ